MNEQRIQELKNALRDILAMVVKRGNMNDDLKQMVMEVLGHVAKRIQELRKEQFEEDPLDEMQPNIITPQIQPAGHPSAQINGFNYDPESGNLLVKFQGDYPQENGPVYQYSNVPENLFKLLRRGAVAPKTSGKNAWHEWKKGLAPSLGASMNALIKQGNYPYTRIA